MPVKPGVKSENRFYRSVREQCSQNWIEEAGTTIVRVMGLKIVSKTCQ